MMMIVTFPSDVEKKIIALAALRELDPSVFVFSLVENEWGKQEALKGSNGFDEADDDRDPEALNRAVAEIVNRTPEQRQAARERAIREFASKTDALLDLDYIAECSLLADPAITLTEVREALSKIPGSMTGDFYRERDER